MEYGMTKCNKKRSADGALSLLVEYDLLQKPFIAFHRHKARGVKK